MTTRETTTRPQLHWNGCLEVWSAAVGKVRLLSYDKQALEDALDKLYREPDDGSEGVCIFTACAVICILLVVAAAVGAWFGG